MSVWSGKPPPCAKIDLVLINIYRKIIASAVTALVIILTTSSANAFWPMNMIFNLFNNSQDDIKIEQIAIEEVKKEYRFEKYKPTNQVEFLPGDWDVKFAGQCVIWVKNATGIDYSGNAAYWGNYITHYDPKVGDIVMIEAGRWGHIGVVIEVGEDYIIVRSRNWRGLWIVSDDRFDKDDLRLKGYIDTTESFEKYGELVVK